MPAENQWVGEVDAYVRLKNVTIDSFSCLEICVYKGIMLTLWPLIMHIYTK